jgi:hypothetical protein
MQNDEYTPPGQYIFRVWLSPSGEPIDIRADYADVGAVYECGALLALWVDDKPDDKDSLPKRVFTAPPGTFSVFARLDSVITVKPAPVQSSTLEGDEIEGER